MNLARSLGVTVCAFAALLIGFTACNPATVTTVPEQAEFELPTTITPEILTAFLSASRSVVIRDDANEGSVVFTATASAESTFTWQVDAPTGLELEICAGQTTADSDCVALPSDGAASGSGLLGILQIKSVLSDPGATGGDVTVRVTATSTDTDGTAEAASDEVTIRVIRPASELAISVSPDSSRVAPRRTVNLVASVSGGTPFAIEGDTGTASCASGDAEKTFTPSELTPPYCITWTIDESGVSQDGGDGGTLTLDALTTGSNGEELSRAAYTAPLGIGSVIFRIDASDRRGNRTTETLAISISSDGELDITDAAAGKTDVPPGQKVAVSGRATGGESPYTMTFRLVGSVLGELLSSECTGMGEDDVCSVEYQAPDDATGAVQVRVSIEDAVGATNSTIVAFSVASPEPLKVELNTPSAVLPSSTTVIKGDVFGGTPPYTVCFRFRDTPLGSIGTVGGDCSPDADNEFLDGLTLCTCGVGSLETEGKVTETVSRNYTAPGTSGDVRLEVLVTDATGANASGTGSVNISSSAGGSGSGGTNPVAVTASASPSPICLGETSTITAAPVNGSSPYQYKFTLQDAALPGESVGPGNFSVAATGTYTAPSSQAGQRAVVVTIRDNAGDLATVVVSIGSRDANALALNGGCDDSNDCTDNVCAAGVCTNPVKADGTTCDDGDPCMELDVCTAGACAGTAIDCDDTNICTDDTCSAGTCFNVPNTAPCDDALFCNGADTCNGGTCSAHAGTPCTTPPNTSCDETADTCGACLTGADCSDGNACTDDVCTAGVCSNPAVADGTTCDDGDPCMENDVCTAGACAGTAIDCDDSNICTDDTCSAGACFNVPNNDPCDDSLFCNGADTCNGGTCSAHVGTPCTTPPNTSCDETADTCGACLTGADCSDGNACTDDVCTAGVCSNPAVADGTACDDGDPCMENDVCTGGSCAGTAIDCDDSNICTDDTCSAGACFNVPNNDPCDDSLFCNGADTCNGGTCSAHVGTPCTTPPNTSCDETADTCGACLIGADCNDGNPCTDDVCTAGVCSNPNNTDACSDGDLCTTGDVCGGGSCTGTAIDCDDANGCTDDSCVAGVCLNTNNTASCDDGLFCTGTDTCSGGTCSAHSGDPCTIPTPVCDDTADTCVGCLSAGDCSDGNACTDDVCTAGVCSNPNNTDACNDGDLCTSGDVCGGGSCAGTAIDCDDSNGCTDDTCSAGTCFNVPNNDPCDDGLFCTGTDTCNGGTCSVHSGDPCTIPTPVCDDTADTCVGCLSAGDCSDGNACTDDVCTAGVCSNPNNTDACNDGDLCTSGDVCGGGSCAGTAIDCDDANVCTNDACVAGICLNTNNTVSCDDGDACTVGDTCSAGSCSAGSPPDCSGAGDACNTASCDGAGADGNCDTLTPTNNGGACDDGTGCSDNDTCAGGTCNDGTTEESTANGNCADGVDNDCDGNMDGADPDC